MPAFDLYELIYLHRFVIEKMESLEASIERCQVMLDRNYKDEYYSSRLLQYTSEHRVYKGIAEKLENFYLFQEAKKYFLDI